MWPTFSFVLGQVIGNFRIVSLLGRGGMGEVYVAEHVGIQTRVAVKVLLPEISNDRDHVQRLFNEARLASRIKHAGITKIFDVGFHERRAYLVMELLEGESLARRIQRGALSEVEIVEIARQTANVLAATHAAGITHRDLKPDNIFLTPDAELASRERVKILDFGIAKLPGSGGPRTIGTMGTPDYMAPEQWGDSARVDWRADAYSLGCVLFEMATGRPPFVTSTIADAYVQHTQSIAPMASECGAAIGPEMDALVGRLLAKDPARRGASMAELVSRLGEITNRLGERSRDPRHAWSAVAPDAPRTALTPAHLSRATPTVPFASSATVPLGAATSVGATSSNSDLIRGSRPTTTLGGSVGELAIEKPSRGRTLASVVVAAAVASVIAVGVLARGAGRDAPPVRATSPRAPAMSASTTATAPAAPAAPTAPTALVPAAPPAPPASTAARATATATTPSTAGAANTTMATSTAASPPSTTVTTATAASTARTAQPAKTRTPTPPTQRSSKSPAPAKRTRPVTPSTAPATRPATPGSELDGRT